MPVVLDVQGGCRIGSAGAPWRAAQTTSSETTGGTRGNSRAIRKPRSKGAGSNPVLENHQAVEGRHRGLDKRGRDRQHRREARRRDNHLRP